MSRFLKAALIVGSVALAGPAAAKFGLGRMATEAEIEAWDIDVRPDGTGLPPGQGSVADGEVIFSERCAVCHGVFGEGAGRWPVLAGGYDTLKSDRPVKTIGSYWPYLSTVFDYVRRAMPFGDARSLSDDEVYALTAYLLYLNDIVTEDSFILSAENFTSIEMPNAQGFSEDPRPDTPLVAQAAPCMSECKPEVTITAHARVLDVTPKDGGNPSGEVIAALDEGGAASEGAANEGGGAIDAALAETGARVFNKCKACHQVGEGAKHRVGPILNGVIGRAPGAAEGFGRYSSAVTEAGAGGMTWTAETLDAFLANPRQSMSGTKMAFPGLRDAEDRAAVIEYLKQFSGQ